jgi:hypothetical protein
MCERLLGVKQIIESLTLDTCSILYIPRELKGYAATIATAMDIPLTDPRRSSKNPPHPVC